MMNQETYDKIQETTVLLCDRLMESVNKRGLEDVSAQIPNLISSVAQFINVMKNDRQ